MIIIGGTKLSPVIRSYQAKKMRIKKLQRKQFIRASYNAQYVLYVLVRYYVRESHRRILTVVRLANCRQATENRDGKTFYKYQVE